MIKNENAPIALKICACAAMLFSAVAAILYGIAYQSSYDTVYRHYAADCMTIKVSFALFAVSALTSAICGIMLRKKFSQRETAPTQLEAFMQWLTAFMFLGFVAVYALNGDNIVSISRFGEFCVKAIPVVSVLSAVPYVLASSRRLSGGILHGITSMIPILWAAAVMFKYYFDLKEVPLNDPELSITIASLSAIILFFLSESRLALGIPFPGGSVFTSLICVCISGCVSAARIILSFTVEEGLLIPTLMECIMMCTIAALAFARFVSTVDKIALKPKEEQKEEIKNDSAASSEGKDGTKSEKNS